MAMAKKPKPDVPWWGRGDALWGGETFEIKDVDEDVLGLAKGDLLRLEKRGRSITLVPHPDNSGKWQDGHDKKHPIKLSPIKLKKTPPESFFKRAFSMLVKFSPRDDGHKFFLVEFKNDGAIEIREKGPGADGGIASVRH
jgi:hypothetical protein